MIINANNIIPEFTAENMNAIIQAYPLGNLHYRTHFVPEFNPTLTYGSLEGTGNAKVMADVVAIGSKAPRKGRDFIEAIKGDIPKIEIARDLNENDLLKIQQLRASAQLYPNNKGVKNQLISKIYEDPTFVIDGINARLEWMAKQVASTGKFVTTATNNAGGVSNVTVDFKVKIQRAMKDWFTDTDANPIEDIENLQNEANENGYEFLTMTMERDTLKKILDNRNTKIFILGTPVSESTVLPSVSLEALNIMLTGKGLPRIILWTSRLSAENKAGALTNLNGWEQGNVLFSVSEKLGTTQYTTTTEFNTQFPDTISQSSLKLHC